MPRKAKATNRAPLLPLPLVERLLSAAMSRGAEFAEVYVEKNASTAAMLDEGSIKSAQSGSVTGVGVRAIRGAQVGYAYSDDLDEAALLRTAQTAALIADGNREPGPVNMARTPLPTYYQVRTPLASIDVARKIELLQQADSAARAYEAIDTLSALPLRRRFHPGAFHPEIQPLWGALRSAREERARSSSGVRGTRSGVTFFPGCACDVVAPDEGRAVRRWFLLGFARKLIAHVAGSLGNQAPRQC